MMLPIAACGETCRRVGPAVARRKKQWTPPHLQIAGVVRGLAAPLLNDLNDPNDYLPVGFEFWPPRPWLRKKSTRGAFSYGFLGRSVQKACSQV